MKWKNLDSHMKFLIVGIVLIVINKLFSFIPVIEDAFLALAEILKPFIYGFILAFLFYPLEGRIERQIEKTKFKDRLNEKQKRLVGSLILFFIVLGIIVFTGWIIVPVVIKNGIEFVNELVKSIPSLIDSINQYVTNETMRMMIINTITSFDLNALIQSYGQATMDAASSMSNYFGEISDLVVGFVLFPYFLYEKESLQTIFTNLISVVFKKKRVREINGYLRASSVIFYSFIYGKIIDSAIIGLIALVAFILFGVHFSVIYALIVGVTNVIPYFGPFIGGIPVTIMVFLTDGFIPAIVVGLFIVALQWFDGLVLGPYILGEQVGVRPFWIVFAITFFQGVFGVVGMLIGVPLIAIIGMLLNDFVAKSKRKREKEELEENEADV